MGTMTCITVDGYELVHSKNAVIPEVMSIFRERDRRELQRRVVHEEPEAEAAFEDAVEYTTSVANAAQRLDIMGFTLKRAEREYEEIRARLVDEAADSVAQEHESNHKHSMLEFYQRELALYRHLTFPNYVAALRAVFEARLQWYELKPGQLDALDQAQRYLLDDRHEDWPQFGFFCNDVRCFLRVALSVAGPAAEVSQSVGDLMASGWIEYSAAVCDEAIRSLVERYPENAPRIILTEGSSDAEILSKALAVLFPHLVGYYTFFDFHGSRAAGGASQLVAVVKAFAAAGVANRVIAVLDNDTAGREALRALKDVTLPSNLTTVHYPDRAWMRSYPTLGPSGKEMLDVNGSAASIELYLGHDVLTEDGRLIPVQWAGFSTAMNAYQGELVAKEQVRRRWLEKAARCLADSSLIAPADWDDLSAVWQQVFGAFRDA